MIEFLFEFILEFLFETILQIAVELGWGSIKHAMRKTRKANPILAAIGIAIIGAGLGLIGSGIFPNRLIKPSPWPGLSLVLAPIGAGTVMQLFGSWRRQRGGDPSSLATFWGGALFAFSMALVRWLIVGSGH
jgi:hypothetical protein